MDRLVEAIGHVRAHRHTLTQGPLVGDIDKVLEAAASWSDHVLASDADDPEKSEPGKEPEDA
jgi:hypothetical protein